MVKYNDRIKPKDIKGNAFIRFFKGLYRNYLIKWYQFKDKHKKATEFLAKLFFFFVFSIGVTIVQYVLMTFLPALFKGFGTEEWGWPMVELERFGGRSYIILGDTNGLGYFLAFEIAVFVAQCVNFPLQRNITYKSHGNPIFQALWYFIGWLLISFFMSALWGIINVILNYYNWPMAIISLIKTLLTGFISMIVFFFIFMIIFPDYKKMYEKKKKKLDKVIKSGKTNEKLSNDVSNLERKYKEEESRKELIENKNKFESLAIRYQSLFKELDNSKENEELENKVLEIEKEALEILSKIE